MSFPQRFSVQKAALIDHTAAGATYAAAGSPTTVKGSAILFMGSFDKTVLVSIDGSNDQFMIPPVTGNSAIVIPIASLSEEGSDGMLVKGTQFYVKQGPDGAPTTGDLLISVGYFS